MVFPLHYIPTAGVGLQLRAAFKKGTEIQYTHGMLSTIASPSNGAGFAHSKQPPAPH